MTSPHLERWYVEGTNLRRRGRTDIALPTAEPPPTYESQFLLDPGENEYMIGWALGPHNDSITEIQSNAGYPGNEDISVIHDYSSNGQGIDTASANAALALNMIPSQSVKFLSAGANPPAIAYSIASGARDAWIDTMAAYCISIEPQVIILCYHHEPGGDYGTTGNTQAMKDYRDATRRIVFRMRAAGVTNVIWQPILETPWNFAGNLAGGSPTWMDFRYWHADWDWRNGVWYEDLTMDVFGLDQYCPMINGTAYRQFSTDLGYVRQDLASTGFPNPNIPIFIMEHGMNNDAVGHNWTDYCTKKRDYMKANNVKLSTYWDNSVFPSGSPYAGERNGRWSFDSTRPVGSHAPDTGFDLDGTKKAGYEIIRAGSTKVVND